MHTIMNDSLPMFSKLVFAAPEDSQEDGFLNTQEIYNMKLQARLAVLSACNTGSGKLYKGEGVMSLARGFLYAGSVNCYDLVAG
jgi:CHAT domain-containing protein